MNTFRESSLLPTLASALAQQDIQRPTPIQRLAIPKLLAGEGLVAVAETGSGKTLAFVLPMLHHLKSLELAGDPVSSPSSPRGLVVVPGRELGEQVSKVIKSLTHTTRLRVRTALGASKKSVARQNVKGTFEILVATPGRLLQLLDRGGLQLGDLRVFVCDEADQMLDPGFVRNVRRALVDAPPTVQLALFSATFPEGLDRIAASLFRIPPARVQTAGSLRLVPTLTTDNRPVPDGKRFGPLMQVLTEHPDWPTLLFANTREQCDRISKWLNAEGLEHALYRGELDRVERRGNLARFRNGELNLLVATDLGGRGLDIPRIRRVVNVHLPQDVANYLHRAGRTARAGREGLLVNLVTPRDEPLLRAVSRVAAQEPE